MIPLGLFQVLIVTIILILLNLKTGDSLAVALTSETVQIRGDGVDRHAFIHSSGREGREVMCEEGYHLHPNGTHCCIKCHIGTYVEEHCTGPDKAPKCTKCPNNTYMDKDNYMQKCFGCKKCRSSFQQVTQNVCTYKQNTVCGCGSNQYKTSDESLFFCKNCSACHNGTIRQHCTKYTNTICECHDGFFLQANNCFPCSSCNKKDCKTECEKTKQSRSYSNPTDLVFILSSMIVIFGAGCVLLLIFKTIKKYLPESLNISSCSVGQQPKKELASKTADKSNNFLLDTKEEKIWVDPQAVTLNQGQELPDCIKSAGETQFADSPAVLYTVVDCIPISRWKEFVRYLGLSDNTIERIFMEQRHMRDAQYEMLREWRLLANYSATVECINRVLSQMELSGCSEVIQEAMAKL